MRTRRWWLKTELKKLKRSWSTRKYLVILIKDVDSIMLGQLWQPYTGLCVVMRNFRRFHSHCLWMRVITIASSIRSDCSGQGWGVLLLYFPNISLLFLSDYSHGWTIYQMQSKQNNLSSIHINLLEYSCYRLSTVDSKSKLIHIQLLCI